MASRFLAKQFPLYQATWAAWDCFVAKNAPRHDIHNGFETGLKSYEISRRLKAPGAARLSQKPSSLLKSASPAESAATRPTSARRLRRSG